MHYLHFHYLVAKLPIHKNLPTVVHVVAYGTRGLLNNTISPGARCRGVIRHSRKGLNVRIPINNRIRGGGILIMGLKRPLILKTSL